VTASAEVWLKRSFCLKQQLHKMPQNSSTLIGENINIIALLVLCTILTVTLWIRNHHSGGGWECRGLQSETLRLHSVVRQNSLVRLGMI